jgi:hypothetical protein
VRVDWPFRLMADTRGQSIGWALVNAPIVTEGHRKQLAQLKKAGYRFAGMTSYLSFPKDEDAGDIVALCEAWFHCFREPDRYLPPGMPRTLLTLSDFTDPTEVSPQKGVKECDFVHVGGETPWKQTIKGWDLACACIKRLAGAGSRGVVLVSAATELIGVEGVTIQPKVPWPEFLGLLSRARFVLVTSGQDPSPRVLAEALCVDTPVVVSGGILGGWHYVHPSTGAFFDGDHDVLDAARHCLSGDLLPRAWFEAHHGPLPAGRRLLELVSSVDPSIEERSHLVLDRGPPTGGSF